MGRHFYRRTAADWSLFFEAAGAIAIVRAALYVCSVRRIKRVLWRVLSASEPLPPHRRRDLEQILRACRSGAKYSLTGSTCLASALVSLAILLRHGHPACLRIGVKREDGAFAAHAWLEYENRVIVGGPLSDIQTYTPLPEVERLFA